MKSKCHQLQLLVLSSCFPFACTLTCNQVQRDMVQDTVRFDITSSHISSVTLQRNTSCTLLLHPVLYGPRKVVMKNWNIWIVSAGAQKVQGQQETCHFWCDTHMNFSFSSPCFNCSSPLSSAFTKSTIVSFEWSWEIWFTLAPWPMSTLMIPKGSCFLTSVGRSLPPYCQPAWHN